jgi:hypothetical protein
MLFINEYISILSIFKLIQGSYRLEYQKRNANFATSEFKTALRHLRFRQGLITG